MRPRGHEGRQLLAHRRTLFPKTDSVKVGRPPDRYCHIFCENAVAPQAEKKELRQAKFMALAGPAFAAPGCGMGGHRSPGLKWSMSGPTASIKFTKTDFPAISNTTARQRMRFNRHENRAGSEYRVKIRAAHADPSDLYFYFTGSGTGGIRNVDGLQHLFTIPDSYSHLLSPF